MDQSIASKFDNRVNQYIGGLHEKLKNITIEQYESTRSRVLIFRSAVHNNQSAEIGLTEDEINSLHAHFYLEYNQLSVKEKLNRVAVSYAIQEDEVIREEAYFFAYFFPGKIFYTKKALRFSLLTDFSIQETQRVFMFFNQEALHSIHVPVNPVLASNLIRFILRSKHNCELSLEEKQYITEITRKLKSIEVKDGKLTLRA